MSQAAKDREKRRQLYAIAIVAIIALLGINIYLFMSGQQKDEQIMQQKIEINKADSLNQILEAEYQTALQELDAKQAENEEMREVIEQQKENLRAMRNKIKKNIDRGVRTEASLKEALGQIDLLKGQATEYLTEIEELKTDKASLEEAKSRLEEEQETLVETIKVREETITQVETEKAQVEEKNQELSDKVDRAKVLQARSIKAKAVRLRNNGKEVDVTKAKKVEKFLVTFNVVENPLTDKGNNKFLLRIIDPIGQTIAVESSGSGTFSNQSEGGTQTRFTISKSFNYDNDAPALNIEWIQNSQLSSPGEYTFELYNKGYFAGSTKLSLK